MRSLPERAVSVVLRRIGGLQRRFSRLESSFGDFKQSL
jgi:hypothetical protein